MATRQVTPWRCTSFRTPEDPIHCSSQPAGLMRSVLDGVRFLLRHRYLRPIIGGWSLAAMAALAVPLLPCGAVVPVVVALGLAQAAGAVTDTI